MMENADDSIIPAVSDTDNALSRPGAICIAGGHRSGTSMLARLLFSCGLDLGPEEDLMPAASDNPEGFWENLRFVGLNDELLNLSGGAWDLPPPEDQSYPESDFSAVRIKAQLLVDSFKERQPWGWKDPRNCLTIRFWRDLIPNLKVVIIVRNPLEAAYSMHKRNGVSYALSLRLWEIYNRRILAATDPATRIISHYQAFFDNPEAELHRIAAFVGLTSEGVSQAAGLISRSRRHTQFSLEQLIDAGIAESTVRFYRELLESRTPDASAATNLPDDRLAGTPNRLNLGVPDFEDVRHELATRRGNEIQQREELDRYRKVIEDLRREMSANSVAAAAEINRRDGRIEELQKAYAHLDELLSREYNHRNELHRELDRTRNELAQQQVQLHHYQEEASRLVELRERFAQTNQLWQQTSVRLSDFETRNVQLRDRLRRQLIEMKRLLRLLDQIEGAADRLRKSRRWKLANPFSALVALLTHRPLAGFGHLDRNVEKYRQWRASYPETKLLDEEIQALRPRQLLAPSSASQVLETAPAPSKPAITPSEITLPEPAEPVVSIIIPVYNQSNLTLSCLHSLQQHTSEIPYEVIVVDDCSTDDTQEVMPQIAGLRYLRADENAGFTASCNRGADAAEGSYLVFLNNDTTVTPGWLSNLLATYTIEPKAGLVGSKLVYPDGRLQEAGGIIWRDGSGWNRGKYQDANLPEFNFLREVDYCSAASVMIPRSLFEEVGGFDEKYSPAYYEDTDLAFKVAATGHKILYQPLSVVIHHEGGTAGTDISAGAKRYQEINRATFVSSWQDRLSTKPVNGDIQAWEAPAGDRQRILVIDHHLPLFDRDSGSLRMSQILSILHDLGHQVTFIPDNLADIPPYGDELRKRGIELIHHPYIKSVADYLQSNGSKYDTVLLSRRDFARKHIEAVRQYAPQAHLIFDTVDLHFLREEREAKLTADVTLQTKATEMRQVEYDLIERADQTWVVSPTEQELLQADFPAKSIEVVSNIVPIDNSPLPFAARSNLLFIGSFLHDPNIDAVIYFVREIFPGVTARLPEAKFYVIGDKAPPEIIALASENVIIAGHQPDLRPYFDSIKLSVAPLRYGAGVKGKINQSMGLGVPVVATSLAIEGMSLRDGEEIMVADTPTAFAEAITKLYSSESDWNRLSENGKEKTRSLFSASAARKQLERLFPRREAVMGAPHSDRQERPITPANL